MMEASLQFDSPLRLQPPDVAAVRRARKSIRALLILCSIVSIWATLPQLAFGQQKEDMPWYDAEKQGVAPVGIEVRPQSSGAEHQSIPDYVPRSSSPSNGTGPNGWGGGGTTAAANLGSVMSVLVWTLAILVGVAMLGVLLWAILGRGKKEFEDDEILPQRTMAESIKQLPFEIEESHKGDFRSLAYQFYQQGDLRRATILLFSHVLVSLDQKGFVRLKKGKTNRQYLRELDSYQSLGGYFSEVMVRFEEAFFGDHEIERSSFESCWNRLDEFQAGLESGAIRAGGVA